MTIDLSEEEIGDLLEAIRDAQAELCCGPGFPEANAIDDRWSALTTKLLYAGLREINASPLASKERS